MIKKILNDTIGVAVGSVGINAANQIEGPMGRVLGTTIGGGLLLEVAPKKKKGGF